MSLPSSFNTVTVYDDFVDLLGAAAGGSVSFAPDSLLYTVADGPTILPVEIVATLDNAGRFSVVLPYSNDPDISGSNVYTVTFNLTGGTPQRPLRKQPASRRLFLDVATPGPLRLRNIGVLEGEPEDFTAATFGVDDDGVPFIETGA